MMSLHTISYRYLLLPIVAMALGICVPGTAYSQETQENEPVYVEVDQMPEFPGGKAKLVEYLANSISYPEESTQKGTVIVSFIVDEKGKVKDVHIVKGLDKDLDNAALKVVKNMPDWRPGEKNGSPVKVRYTLPVAF